MTDHPAKNKAAKTTGPHAGAQVVEQERRRSVRFMLVASAEAEDLANGLCLNARTSDISVHGCYLDTINPFPPGSRIRVHLTKGNETFHSLGVVMYTHVGMGMGIAFTEINWGAREILQRWVAELESGRAIEISPDTAQIHAPGLSERPSVSLQIERLVRTLESKRLLTEAEAQQILRSMPD